MLDLTECAIVGAARCPVSKHQRDTVIDAMDIALVSQAPRLRSLRIWLTGNFLCDQSVTIFLQRLEVGALSLRTLYVSLLPVA